MTPALLLRAAIVPALSLLPPAMDSQPARALLLAIALQESALENRVQIRGPARSYWQFELGGLTGVLRHEATASTVYALCRALDYAAAAPRELHVAMTHNDVLAAGIGRLNLWWHPMRPPTDERAAWEMYLATWRPGKPHPERWPRCWATAVEATV